MAGLLDGRLDRAIYAGFRGKLLGGVIRRAALPAGGALNANGDPDSVVPKDTRIEGFPENYSRFTKAQAGIPGTDLKLNIFAASAPGFEPRAGDQARLDRKIAGRSVGQWYQIRGPVEIDPAGVLWVCHSFEIKAPPP